MPFYVVFGDLEPPGARTGDRPDGGMTGVARDPYASRGAAEAAGRASHGEGRFMVVEADSPEEALFQLPGFEPPPGFLLRRMDDAARARRRETGGASVTWSEFAAEDPDLAAFGAALFAARVPADLRRDENFTGYAFLATVRGDGAPRVHPVCPVMTGGRLYVSIAPHSPKLGDLRRDGRFVLHAPLGDEDREFSIRGRAVETNDEATRAAFAAAAEGWMTLHEEHVVFAFDIERVDATTWQEVSQPNTQPVRYRWQAR